MRRWKYVGLFATVAALAVGVLGYFELRNTTTTVSADDAVARFEAAPAAGTVAEDGAVAASGAASPSPAESMPAGDPDDARVSLPAPGVYPLSVTGSESIDLATGASHTYPGEGFLTVTATDCGVDLRFDFIVERWQSLELCDGPDGPQLVGEQIFHSFFGQEDLVVRTCTESPVTAGADTWTCRGASSVAVRSVTTERAERPLPDGTSVDALVVVTELIEGDHPDNVESIELWWDLESGLPVYERRTYDFTLDTPLGDAGYVEEYEAVLEARQPIS